MKKLTHRVVANAIKDYTRVNDLKVRARYGHERLVSLHIEVSDDETPSDLHDLSEGVEFKIGEEKNGTVVIHVDPINRNHDRYGEIETAIQKIVSEDERIISFHDLRIVGCDYDICNVVFDVVLETGIDEQEEYDITQLLSEELTTRFPKMRFVIKSGPAYAYNLSSK